MSATRNTTSYKTPFCAVCKAAGKSEAIYTTHNVKNSSGKVTCMTLLSQRCENCNQHGHTKKYCHAVSKIKEKVKSNKNMTVICCAKPIATKNRYELDEDDEDNDDHVVVTTPNTKRSYASVAATTPVVVSVSLPVPVSVPEPKKVVTTKRYASWADADDSDSDDE